MAKEGAPTTLKQDEIDLADLFNKLHAARFTPIEMPALEKSLLDLMQKIKEKLRIPNDKDVNLLIYGPRTTLHILCGRLEYFSKNINEANPKLIEEIADLIKKYITYGANLDIEAEIHAPPRYPTMTIAEWLNLNKELSAKYGFVAPLEKEFTLAHDLKKLCIDFTDMQSIMGWNYDPEGMKDIFDTFEHIRKKINNVMLADLNLPVNLQDTAKPPLHVLCDILGYTHNSLGRAQQKYRPVYKRVATETIELIKSLIARGARLDVAAMSRIGYLQDQMMSVAQRLQKSDPVLLDELHKIQNQYEQNLKQQLKAGLGGSKQDVTDELQSIMLDYARTKPAKEEPSKPPKIKRKKPE